MLNTYFFWFFSGNHDILVPKHTREKKMENTKEKRRKADKWGSWITIAANYVVKFTGTVIFALLVWYSLCYTWYVLPGGREIPVDMQDSIWINLVSAVFAAGFAAVLLAVDRKISPKVQQITARVSVILAVLWVGGAGFWWINSAVRVPNGDCAYIYGGASYFLEGQFSFLEGPRSYCVMYPHQLGLIALTELLFLVVGAYNFYAFQVMCVLFSMGIVFAGYLVLRELVPGMAAVIFYCVMMSGCLPLIFYTSWVYGDLPSIFFVVMAVWMLIRYVKSGRIGWLPGMVSMVTMAVLNRKNTMIFIVAVCLTVLVSMFRKRDWKLFCAAVMCVLMPWLVYTGVYKMYELRSGYESYPGIPIITWVDMGLHDVDGICGWYDNSAKELYYSTECDPEQTEALSKLRMRDRLRELSGNPSYARDFFKKKILSQWNMPLYQSLFFSTMYAEGDVPEADSFVSQLENKYFFNVLAFCDRLQFVVYLGFFCYFVWGIKKDGDIRLQITAVAIIGGFLFSILWEAKARYILPYYVMIFPFTAIGYRQALLAAAGKLQRGSIISRRFGQEIPVAEGNDSQKAS